MSKQQAAVKSVIAEFSPDFQAGNSAFLRSAALFPLVKCVEVYACQIDRLTKAQNGPRSNPQNTRGQCPLSQELSGWQAGKFFALPPSHVPSVYQLGKNKIRFALDQQETKFSTTAKKGCAKP